MHAFTTILKMETRLLIREPAWWLASIVLPSVVLLGLGLVFAPHRPDPALGGQRFIDLFVPSLLVITLATLGLQTLPVRLATYRERGILRRFSTTPLRPSQVLLAQLVVYLVTAVLALVLLIVVGYVAFAIPIPRDPIGYIAAFLVGMSSLFALGLLIAAIVPSTRAASALGLPLFFVAMFLGGVYLPRWLLPEFLGTLGTYAPPGVEGLQDAWLGAPVDLVPLVVMGVGAVAIGALAVRVFRWE
jgi:ABC-2 type transport system permease protein